MIKKNEMKRNAGYINVYGAREHNLKDVDVSIPKGTLTVITGPSGSGKSSLALDVLFAEGKRRYMESLSAYARQFLGTTKKPDVDKIDGLCPSIAIEQKTVSSNPRSTVGTITEINDYLRVLYARIGVVHCPDCTMPIQAESPDAITVALSKKFAGQFVTIVAPVSHQKKGEFVQQLSQLFQAGFYRFIVDGINYKFTSLDDINNLNLKKTYKHTIDLLIDSFEVSSDERSRVQEAIEKAFKNADGVCKVICGDEEHWYSSHRMCVRCNVSVPEVEPRLFSFNSPIGACPLCHGLGSLYEWEPHAEPNSWLAEIPAYVSKYTTEKTCRGCEGKRLNKFALATTLDGATIYDLCNKSIKDLIAFFNIIQLDDTAREIGQGLIKEITNRLLFLYDVGLGYLTLNRSARTLSGGEGQRIRLATQIGSALSGVLYILDEPSIGLHQRDNDRLIEMLKKLRDLDNTVVVVEHDIDTMQQADYLIDMGPGAGMLGGKITAYGNPQELADNKQSLTGAYLSGRRIIVLPTQLRKSEGFLTIHHARKNNLKDLTVQFPLKVLCGVSGVSGSGKSSLVMQELVPALDRELNARQVMRGAGSLDNDLTGADKIESVIVIDQKPIGRTPRSNPATYLGIFDEIRKLYASLPLSNARGYKVGRFSFNMPEGRCSACKGDGVVTVEMHFLPEVSMVCKACKGRRYNAETLEITYRDKSIADVLEMTAYEAAQFFVAHKQLAKRLQLLSDVGLDYLKLGQPATTLSGGEAQRIKLVDELAKRGNDTLYILDEPTTGLHPSDIEKLLKVLNSLVDKGNSMIIIEHNLDVLKTVDYLIDLGPEGGDQGGTLVATGTPQEVAACAASYTGHYLKKVLTV
jgi:excinuclease ABC subunit A